jgi:hypothetical protein
MLVLINRLMGPPLASLRVMVSLVVMSCWCRSVFAEVRKFRNLPALVERSFSEGSLHHSFRSQLEAPPLLLLACPFFVSIVG